MLIKNIKHKEIKIFALRNAQAENANSNFKELEEMKIETSFNHFDSIEPKELEGAMKATYWGLISKAKKSIDFKAAQDLVLNTYSK